MFLHMPYPGASSREITRRSNTVLTQESLITQRLMQVVN